MFILAKLANEILMDEALKAEKAQAQTVPVLDPMASMLADLQAPVSISIEAAPPVPAEPPSRGSAPQREGMTDRAKENTKTLSQPPAAVEHMKKGPKELTKEVARSAPEAKSEEVALLESVSGLESEIDAIKKQIEEATKALNTSQSERKKSLLTTLNTLYELMDNNARRVVRFKDQIVAIDEKRDIKSAELSPQAQKKAEEITAKMTKKKDEIKALAEELASLTEEQFLKYGGTETEQRRVTMSPNPDMQAALSRLCLLLATDQSQAMSIRAGVLEVLKNLWSKIKSVFSGLDELDKDLAEYSKLVAG